MCFQAMEGLAGRIVADGLSVRSVEEIVALGDVHDRPVPSRRPRRRSSSPGLQETAEQLSDRLDTRVQVSMGRSKGRVVIEFAGPEDLNRIVDLLLEPGTAT